MRQGHHVAHPALVIQQQIGVRARHGRVGEGARRLARPHRRVDPGGGEEAPADRGQLRRKRAHRPTSTVSLGLAPRDQPVVILRQRRVPIPERQCLDPEPARLQPVIAMRELAGSSSRTARDQRVDDLVLDKIRQIARRDRPREAAPAVLDLLVLGERVGDQRKGPRVLAQDFADRDGGLAAHLGVAVGQQVEHLGLGQLLAAKRKPQIGHGLVEQPGPGGARRRPISRAAASRARPTAGAGERRGCRAATAR